MANFWPNLGIFVANSAKNVLGIPDKIWIEVKIDARIMTFKLLKIHLFGYSRLMMNFRYYYSDYISHIYIIWAGNWAEIGKKRQNYSLFFKKLLGFGPINDFQINIFNTKYIIMYLTYNLCTLYYLLILCSHLITSLMVNLQYYLIFHIKNNGFLILLISGLITIIGFQACNSI